jgi:hypothetical protein
MMGVLNGNKTITQLLGNNLGAAEFLKDYKEQDPTYFGGYKH